MDISTKNDRFGLPLSLVEALEADPSDDAALLASYLAGASISGHPPVSALIRSRAFLPTRAAGASGDMRREVFSLDQLLRDPLIKMVMASDHVVEDDIRAVMPVTHAQDRLAECFTDRLAA